MEAELLSRLEKAVTRLESISSAAPLSRDFNFSGGDDVSAAASDPAIAAFDDFMVSRVGRVSAVAEKIGGKVLEASDVLKEAFSALRDLLVRVKHTQKPDMNGMAEFLKPLNEVIMKATVLTEGKRSEFFNHQKSVADSLSALAWIAFTGKDCGMSMPIAHVEESWQMAEFYNNKVLTEYKNKDPNHAEWAKAMKEVYLPGLRDYVKSYYPLGPVWGTSGKATVSAVPKAATPAAPAPPPATLLSSDSPKPSSS